MEEFEDLFLDGEYYRPLLLHLLYMVRASTIIQSLEDVQCFELYRLVLEVFYWRCMTNFLMPVQFNYHNFQQCILSLFIILYYVPTYMDLQKFYYFSLKNETITPPFYQSHNQKHGVRQHLQKGWIGATSRAITSSLIYFMPFVSFWFSSVCRTIHKLQSLFIVPTSMIYNISYNSVLFEM